MSVAMTLPQRVLATARAPKGLARLCIANSLHSGWLARLDRPSWPPVAAGAPKGPKNGNYKHGRYTKEVAATRQWLREAIDTLRELKKPTY
jgi:hypothetical protein